MKSSLLPLVFAFALISATWLALAEPPAASNLPAPRASPSTPAPASSSTPAPTPPSTPAPAPKPTITRIVQRYVAPTVAPESFAGQPKTYYLGGGSYARIEESFDPDQATQNLIIVREPDVWIINYFTRHGQHSVDVTPPFVMHFGILPADAPGELSQLEFGKEQAFFRDKQAERLEPQVVAGQMCERYELKRGDYRLVLNVRADQKTPYHLDVFKDDKTAFSIHYDSYETGLPFDPALFDPPRSVIISEPSPK